MSPKRSEKISAFDRLKAAADSVNLARADLEIPPAMWHEPAESWQVVVTGTIDPRQHSPQWFRLIGAIDDNELAAAQKTTSIVSLPNTGAMPNRPVLPQVGFVQFDVGAFSVSVIQDKWTIRTSSEANRNRIVDVVSLAFTKLSEIYVSAFGINKEFGIKLRDATAKQFLADRLSRSDLALPSGNAEGSITYAIRVGDTTTNYFLSPFGLDEKWLSVVYNRHHPITVKEGYYDVGKMIRDSADQDWQSASKYAADLSACVDRA